jgi:DNA-binding NarL/FixJ family response regulator
MSRVVLAHRNPAFRKQLIDLLVMGGMEVDDSVEDFCDIEKQIAFGANDILVVDVGFFTRGIRDCIRLMKERHPKVQIVFVGPEPRAYYARHMGEIGADLYLSEGENPHEWLRKLRALPPKLQLFGTGTEECRM